MSLALILRGSAAGGTALVRSSRALPVIKRTFDATKLAIATIGRAAGATGGAAPKLAYIAKLGVDALTALTIGDFLISTVKDILGGMGASDEQQEVVATSIVAKLASASPFMANGLSTQLGAIDFAGWRDVLIQASREAVGQLDDEQDKNFVEQIIMVMTDQAAAAGAAAKPQLDTAAREWARAMRACGLRVDPNLPVSALLALFQSQDGLRESLLTYQELSTTDG